MKEYEVGIDPERVEIPHTGVLFLGDQSPWSGGFLRAIATKRAGITNSNYFVQDADIPWVQNGRGEPKVVQGWVDYWALAARHPFSFEIPKISIDSARQSLNGPKGLSYLSGPKTSLTIGSVVDSPTVGGLVKQVLMEEVIWARTIAEAIGDDDAVARANEIQEAIKATERLGEQISVTASLSRVSEIGGIVNHFREVPPRLVDVLGAEMYWEINGDGTRHVYNGGKKREVLVPKGKALPLEVAASEGILVFTALPYLSEIVAVRDRYVPNIRIRTLQIGFNWELRDDPMEALWERFVEKKRIRGQTVEKPEDEIQQIKDYWAKRPTTISHAILGGQLNPKLTYSEI